MTVTEFKELKPEHKDLEGDQLWNAMEDYMLRQQQGSEVLKVIMPIWKTHTFRWLFYRKVQNLIFTNPKTDKWSSANRCKDCKTGVNFRIVWSVKVGDKYETTSKCPNCHEDYIAEPNTNLSHKLWNLYKGTIALFWTILDKVHLIRSSMDGRYGMFGDEARYIQAWEFQHDKWKTVNGNEQGNKRLTLKPVFRSRKWWEHIIIEKPIHKF